MERRQKLKVKQTQQQAIDQSSCHKILCEVVSTLELLVPEYKGQRLFGGYQCFNFQKSLEELRSQAETQCFLFNITYLKFIQQYDEYEFPENFSKEKMIQYLEFLKQKCEYCDIIYFDKILNVLKGKTTSLNLPSTSHGGSRRLNKIEMGNLMNAGIRAGYSNSIRENKVKEEYKAKGYYKGNVVFNSNKPVYEELSKMPKKINEAIPGYQYQEPEYDDDR